MINRHSFGIAAVTTAFIGTAAAALLTTTASAMPTDNNQCNAGDLTASITDNGPGAGSRTYSLDLAAKPGVSCEVGAALNSPSSSRPMAARRTSPPPARTRTPGPRSPSIPRTPRKSASRPPTNPASRSPRCTSTCRRAARTPSRPSRGRPAASPGAPSSPPRSPSRQPVESRPQSVVAAHRWMGGHNVGQVVSTRARRTARWSAVRDSAESVRA